MNQFNSIKVSKWDFNISTSSFIELAWLRDRNALVILCPSSESTIFFGDLYEKKERIYLQELFMKKWLQSNRHIPNYK